MTITVLPTPAFSRRYSYAHVDSLGRFLIHEAVYDNATHSYDTTHGTTLERYDPSTNAWSTLAEVSPSIQTYGTCIDGSNRIYRVGGQDLSANTSFNLLNIYDPGSDAWSAGADLPNITYQAPAAWIDNSGQLWAAGSFTTAGFPINRLYSYSAGIWTTRADPPFNLAGETALVDISNNFYLFGAAINLGHVSNRLQIYNTAGDTWTSSVIPVSVSLAQVMFDRTNGLIFVFGLTSTQVTAYRYTIASATWTTLSAFTHSVTFAAFSGCGFHPNLNACFLFGITTGQSGGLTSDTNIYRYDVATDSWSTTGDHLSAPRFDADYLQTAFDGTGFYIPQGAFNTAGGQDAVNVVEYFVPSTSGTAVLGFGAGVSLAVPTRARSYALVIGD